VQPRVRFSALTAAHGPCQRGLQDSHLSPPHIGSVPVRPVVQEVKRQLSCEYLSGSFSCSYLGCRIGHTVAQLMLFSELALTRETVRQARRTKNARPVVADSRATFSDKTCLPSMRGFESSSLNVSHQNRPKNTHGTKQG
jgi:hypothetical protein